MNNTASKAQYFVCFSNDEDRKKETDSRPLSVSSYSCISGKIPDLSCYGLFFLVAVSLVELVHASCCVHKLHLACIERVRSV